MADIGRFFNPDPLSEKYAYQSHYNFSENRVVDARELEELEAVPADNFKNSHTTLVLIGLGRANGAAGDGVKNGSNTLYSNLSSNLQTDGGLATLRGNLGSSTAVVTYAGTDSGLAAEHMVETIDNYRSVNPDGSIIMIGHSLGGKDILNAAASTKQDINLVLTMEPVSVSAQGGRAYEGSPYKANLGENVKNIINLNADKNMFTGGGGIKKNNTQGFLNKTMKGTSHSSIDNAMTPYLKPLIKRTSQGVDPIKWFNNANWSNFNQSIPKDKENEKGTSGS
ncbi:hypothetical protein [Empedobacter brevis]|uniref:hypothetical protein n=1 Tax=Empedobacter brevis TaxID=247 RepID=UPI0033408AD1